MITFPNSLSLHAENGKLVGTARAAGLQVAREVAQRWLWGKSPEWLVIIWDAEGMPVESIALTEPKGACHE